MAIEGGEMRNAAEMRRLVIVEDDAKFAATLSRSFERRGYEVRVAPSQQALNAFDPAILIVVLTGFASIATAVEAIKLGACHYLAKPSNTDDIEAAFGRAVGDAQAPVTERASSIKTLEWERIHETLAETDFNISETARRLGMHRRTLARKLEKRQVK
jgi:two-component system response regulator RegA